MQYRGVNRYRGDCEECKAFVPAKGGTLYRLAGGRHVVYHLACKKLGEGAEARVMTVRTSGGTFIRNSAGRCEDAPCCGCCTI